MNLPIRSRRQAAFFAIGLLIALAVFLVLCYKSFALSTSMSLSKISDTIQATGGYGGVLLTNALVAVCILLFIMQLRWDALRVTLTVAVALILGYGVTAAFNLDAATRFKQGEAKITVATEAESLVNFNYGDDVTFQFNNPDEAANEIRATFAGRSGDVITLYAYAEDEESGLDLHLQLLDASGAVIAENSAATEAQTKDHRRKLKSPGDAIIENFALPADGTYTAVVTPEAGSEPVQAEGTLEMDTDAEAPVDFVYNDPKSVNFNQADAEKPISEVFYRFAGSKGDVVNVIAAAARQNVEVNLEVELLDSSGSLLAQNKNASAEQRQAFKRDLQSTKDAIIEGFTLPADGIYTVHARPEPISGGTKFSEMVDRTNVAYNAFLLGPLSRLNRWVDWIRDAITLIMVGLAIAIVFRAEQFSLGAEGQLYFGALVSGVMVLSFGNHLAKGLMVPIALLSAATAGFLWGLLPGVLKAYLGANELVSTLMLNTIATRFYEMVLTFQLQPPDAGYTASDWFPKSGLLSPIVDVGGVQITIGIFVLIALVVLTWLLIQRTPLGYEIRMIGANRKFADYGGVNTRRTIMLTMAISGAVAGLAGAHLAMGVHRKLILNISLGLAFQGVVVALLARNNPLVVPFTGLLYAYLRTGARFMESDANISSEVVNIIQAVIILLITAEALVTFFQRRRIRRRGTVELDIAPPQHLMETPPTPQEGAHVG